MDGPALLQLQDRIISREEAQVVQNTLRKFNELEASRLGFANQWEEVAELIMPSHRNTFTAGAQNTPGEKRTQRQVDATGMLALAKFKAICDSLLTPANQEWHGLEADDPYVMKDRATRLWFEEVTRILFKWRYAMHANFVAQNQAVFESLGAFGTGALFIDDNDGPEGGTRYMALPLGEWRLYTNHQNRVIGGIRYFRMKAHQVVTMFQPEWIPARIRSAIAQNNANAFFSFLHHIWPREDYDFRRRDAKGKKWGSCFISMEGQCFMRPESGYRTFPVATSRYAQAPAEEYGRGPAMDVLPGLKTLNVQKKVFLKQGHRAAEPVLLTYDDGLLNLSLRPGSPNPGGVNSEGRPLVHALPAGDINISEKMMEVEQTIINDAFLVTMFQILVETPTMSATEVMERATEKGVLLAPTVGRQSTDYVAPTVHRELDVLSSQHLLPPMPPRLREARGLYNVKYTSPIAKQARAQHAAGFLRTVEVGTQVASATQDASVFASINMDKGMRLVADVNNVPESVMASDDEIDQKRQQRAKAAKAQQQLQAMPAQAAMIKAQAVAQEKGAGQPQQQQGPV